MTGEFIQIVEDEGLIALHLTEILERAGYRVINLACSGEMAIRLLEKSPKPNLIIMDIGLAGSLNGIETAQHIRRYCDIPILFLTAYANITKVEEMKNISSCSYLGKPYLEHDLLSAIENCLHL